MLSKVIRSAADGLAEPSRVAILAMRSWSEWLDEVEPLHACQACGAPHVEHRSYSCDAVEQFGELRLLRDACHRLRVGVAAKGRR